jgi:hypothetical protein
MSMLELQRNERRLSEDGDIGLVIGLNDKLAEKPAFNPYGKAGRDYKISPFVIYTDKTGHDYNPKDKKCGSHAKEGPYFWTPKKELVLTNEYKNQDSAERNVDPLQGYENVGRFLLSGIALGILKNIPTTEGSAPDAIKNSLKTFSRQLLYTSGKNISPFLAQRYGFLKGFSNVEGYYTVEVDIAGVKDQRPLTACGKGESPSVQFLKDRAQDAFTRPLAHGSAIDSRIGELYNDVCGLTGADMRYMNGDLRGLEDLRRFFSKLAKLDIHNIHQAGQEQYVTSIPVNLPAGTSIDGMIIPVDTTVNGIVRRYVKPEGLGTYVPNELGNWVYDGMDRLLYNFVQSLFGTAVAEQIGVEEQLLAHIKTRTALAHLFGLREPLRHYT